MAEKEGFEPPVELPLQLISSQSHSTTLALLRQKSWDQRDSWSHCKDRMAISRHLFIGRTIGLD